MAKMWLLIVMAGVAVGFGVFWFSRIRQARSTARGGDASPTPLHLGIGFVTNFFDTLGIGSFATTTAIYKLKKLVDDRVIPGTLNVGHTFPTVTQALIYIAIVQVDFLTLVALIGAAVAGAYLGAGVVGKWPRRQVQIGMGLALIAAASLMLLSLLNLLPGTGEALGLSGTKLLLGIGGNFLLGALMTLGIGLYAPCMILISLLGMNSTAAFPIMMGSCAFLMPIGSVRFVNLRSYDLRAAIGLAIGGIPAVLIAAYLVTSLPLNAVRWLVIVVVCYTAAMMLRSALSERQAAAAPRDLDVEPA